MAAPPPPHRRVSGNRRGRHNLVTADSAAAKAVALTLKLLIRRECRRNQFGCRCRSIAASGWLVALDYNGVSIGAVSANASAITQARVRYCNQCPNRPARRDCLAAPVRCLDADRSRWSNIEITSSPATAAALKHSKRHRLECIDWRQRRLHEVNTWYSAQETWYW